MWSEDEEEEEDDVRIESEIDSEIEAMMYAQIHYELPNSLNTTNNQITDEQSLKINDINQPVHSSLFVDRDSIGIKDITEAKTANTLVDRDSIGIKNKTEAKTANTPIPEKQVDLNLEEVSAKKQTKSSKKVKTKDGRKRKHCPEEKGLIIGIKKRKQCLVNSVIIISDSDVSPRKQSRSKERERGFVTVSIDDDKSSKAKNRKKSKLDKKNKKKRQAASDIIELSNSEDDMANAPTSVSLPQDIVLNLQNGRTQSRNIDYNSDTDDFELEKIRAKMSDGNWQILNIDRYSAVNNKSRYFKNNNMGGVRCRHCQQYGHSTFACPQPKKPVMCIYCGRPNHTFHNCPDAMCGRCWRPGHSSNFCWMTNRMLNIRCTLCTCRGHSEYQCPDYWRRYYLTTTVGPPVPSNKQFKDTGRIYCYNCGREGHYGFICKKPPMHITMQPASPYIVYYEEPNLHNRQNGIFIPHQRPDVKFQYAESSMYSSRINSKRSWKKHQWRNKKKEKNINGISNDQKKQDRKEKKAKKKKAKKLFPECGENAGQEPPKFRIKNAKQIFWKRKENLEGLGLEVPILKTRKAKKRFRQFLKHQQKLFQ